MKFHPLLSCFAALTLYFSLTNCSHPSTNELTPTMDPLEALAAHKITDHFGVNGIRTLPDEGKVLFANPPSRYELPIGASPKSVQFGFGIVAGAIVNKPPTQGVEFHVLLKNQAGQESTLWSAKLDPLTNTADRGLHHATVPITAGDSDKLIFETTALHDPLACWAYWSALSVNR